MCQDLAEENEPIVQNVEKDSSRFKEEQVQRPWGRNELGLSKQQKEATGAGKQLRGKRRDEQGLVHMGPRGSGREFAFYSLSLEKPGGGSEQVSDRTRAKCEAKTLHLYNQEWAPPPLNFVL